VKKTFFKKIAGAAIFLFGIVPASFSQDFSSIEKYEPRPSAVAENRELSELRLLPPFARITRNSEPIGVSDGKPVVAWRGETVIFRVGVFSGKSAVKNLSFPRKISLVSTNSASAKKIDAEIFPVRWAIGRGNEQFSDIVDFPKSNANIPAGTLREFLVSAKIPTNAATGIYRGEFSVRSAGKISADFAKAKFSVEVLPATLPPPSQRAVHLDLWQHPQAVARATGTTPWSPKHFAALKPMMERLRDLGQKVITCSIIDEPWSHQTYDDWDSMVEWTRERDGTWSFDYSAFDAWVSFMTEKIGIAEQISCYSMLPWSMKIGYFDKSDGVKKTFPLDISSASYDEIWGAFLRDFTKHLKEKGWLEKTCIAIDERPDALVDAARKTLERHAPELGIVSANDHPTRMSAFVRDISPVFQHSGGDIPELAKKRRAEGKKTTFYVCTNPPRPNTFTHSEPAEARWLGLYAAANGFDGVLRWAFNSWNKNPFETTAFGNWPAGDCFLVYPENRSSMRLEHFRDGLEDFEKIRILREHASAKNASQKLQKSVVALDDYLKKNFTVETGGGSEHAEQVASAISLIDAASREL